MAAGAILLAVVPSAGPLRLLAPPLVRLGLALWAAAVFQVGPHHHTPWRYDVPGAVLTTVGWVASTQLFAVYVRFAGQANDVQTTVGALLLALSLLYLLSVALLVGAELNDVLARRSGIVQQPTTVVDRVRSLRR